MNETSMNSQLIETENSKMPNSSLNMLVRAVLMDKKPDEVPILVESVLSKVMEEFENRIANQFELVRFLAMIFFMFGVSLTSMLPL
ncbi:kinesin-like protein KIN-14I [Bidens hawaiensis]|uniref:kinesin-like protein KIN-14I n=1 Tax=Bidens hawaiensis TaxID=980011 RepID=UPI00404A099A